MNKHCEKILYWAPRTLAILYILFISLFALDVFGEEFSVFALAVHMVPSMLLVITLIASWYWEIIGGIIFMMLGFVYIMIMTNEAIVAYVIMSGPAFVIGSLFIFNHFKPIYFFIGHR